MADREIGNRLKVARERLKLTQAKACEALGIPKPQTLSAYESGVNSPPIETLKGLSQLYHVSIDWIVWGDDSIPYQKGTAAYISDLLAALDELGLSIDEDFDLNGNPNGSFVIRLKNDNLRGFNALISDLQRIGGIRGMVDKDDYEMLVRKKINSRAAESNNFERIPPKKESDEFAELADIDGELPF